MPQALAVVPVLLAAQLAVVPPLEPAQVHDHGPEPVTDEAVPVLHRLVVGAVLTVVPFADPHAPFTALGTMMLTVRLLWVVALPSLTLSVQT
jgi:hypothetical protein